VPKLLQKYELRMLVEELKDRVSLTQEDWKLTVSRECDRLRACGWRSEYDFLIPNRLMALLEEPEESAKPAQSGTANGTAMNNSDDRDEFAALEAAARDLIRLDRYERRAWSRQKRAVLELANLKLARRISEDA
jgi:hypothetical protein